MHSVVRKLASVLVVAAVAIACDEPVSQGQPLSRDHLNVTEQFSATLSPANEIPAITDTATTSDNSTGTATVWVIDDTILVLSVDIANVDTPTLAHIHAPGNATQNAGVIVNIMTGAAATRNFARYTGAYGDVQVVKSSRRTSAINYDSLLTLIRTGNAYVNVHSKRHPGGIMRGQLQ